MEINMNISANELDKVSVDAAKLSSNFGEIAYSCGGNEGAALKSAIIDRFPLATWLLNTPMARMMREKSRSGLSGIHKDGENWVMDVPATFYTEPAASTQNECCWVPFDFARCDNKVPVNLLCLKDCDSVFDSLVYDVVRISGRDAVPGIAASGERLAEVNERIAKLSMAFLTAQNVVLGLDATYTDTLKPFHGLLVACADILRIRDDPFACLQIHERRRVAEREVDLLPVQNLIDDHVMLLAAEMRQRGADFLDVVEQIGENDDEAAAAALLREAVQRHGQIRLIRRLVGDQRVADGPQMFGAALRGKQGATSRIEQRQPDAVLMMDGDVRQRRRQTAGVAVLAVRLLVRRVGHGARRVHQQMDAKARLLFILAEIQPFVFSVNLPVQMLGIVSGHVLPIVRELDGDAFQLASMRTRHRPLHRETGAEGQTRQTRHILRAQQLTDSVFDRHVAPRRLFTCEMICFTLLLL